MRDKLGRFIKGNHIKTEFKKGQIPWNKDKICPSMSKAKMGEKNPMWKNGRRKFNGYIKILIPNHPFADSMGYVLEHRLVMERIIGRYLKPEEIIHHINGIRNDNRRKNLKLFANKDAHSKHHFPKGSIFGKNLH